GDRRKRCRGGAACICLAPLPHLEPHRQRNLRFRGERRGLSEYFAHRLRREYGPVPASYCSSVLYGLCFGRQREPKRASFSCFALDADVTAVAADDFFGNVKPQSGSFVIQDRKSTRLNSS